MTRRLAIYRYLDPGETLGEVLGGFIMALTFTLGLMYLQQTSNSKRMSWSWRWWYATAWGVIDAILFLLDSLFYRSRHASFFQALKNTRSETEALAALEEESGLEDEPLAAHPEDRARLYQSLHALSARATTSPKGPTAARYRDCCHRLRSSIGQGRSRCDPASFCLPIPIWRCMCLAGY